MDYDMTGQELNVGDFVAVPDVSRTISLGVLTEINGDSVVVKRPYGSRHRTRTGGLGARYVPKATLRGLRCLKRYVVKFYPIGGTLFRLNRPYWVNYTENADFTREANNTLTQELYALSAELRKREQDKKANT